MNRVIGHIDLDYFYAQVEEVENPSIKDKPVIVCVFSGRTEESGVVSTSNYKARALGVGSGMPIAAAKAKLQGHDPVVIRMQHEKYEAVSDRVMQLVAERVDLLEKTGIDEAFFDVSASTEGDYSAATQLAKGIKSVLYQSEHLTCSIGLGRSKVVAKVGSDFAKPDGLTMVSPESTETFLNPLKVTKLYGVGPKTAASLAEVGVKTVGDLARANPSEIDRRLGRKLASYLLAAATGTDADPVLVDQQPTQFSRIVTLKRDTRDAEEAFGQLAQGVEHIQGKLSASGKSFRTLSAIGILTDLSTKTKSKTFDTPISDAATIKDSGLALFRDLASSVDKDFRRVGIRVSELSDVGGQKPLSEFLEEAR
ncbi:MAG: DNA polymerase IV [Thaumarchaeota archaeon]|nr:DNA polymerase IV [Nitrososphaerota archaeon]